MRVSTDLELVSIKDKKKKRPEPWGTDLEVVSLEDSYYVQYEKKNQIIIFN